MTPTMRFCLLLSLPAAAVAISFPSHIASSMVIQRGSPFELHGVDAPQAVVTVTADFLGSAVQANAGADGHFSITLPAQEAATTPTVISVNSTSGSSAQLTDILFGDVYLSSGQSNMELSVSWCYDYAKFVEESAQYGATLRIAQVALLPEYYNVSEPQTNLTMAQPWSRAAPSNVGAMSAIAYFTALEMVKARPNVPIGAIASSWGGTPQEVWMPPDSFAACDWQPNAAAAQGQAQGQGRGLALADEPGLYSPGRHPEVELSAGPPTIHSTLWNSMIAPLLSLRVSGWYWYQGESNVGQACFSRCFPAMIEAWRQHWRAPDTPFIFFQLAPWPRLNDGGIPKQRAAQVNATRLPNVGMVVAADRGDAAGAFHPIHPPVKEELSHRAFLVTDRLVYKNLSAPLQGPQPLRATFVPWDASWGDFHYGTGAGTYVCGPASPQFLCGGIVVEFDQTLVLDRTLGQDNAWVASGLAPARAATNDLVVWDNTSTQFQRAEITAIRGNVLQLNITWTFGGQPPTQLKYGWSDYPQMPLVNAHGLPAPPFAVPIE